MLRTTMIAAALALSACASTGDTQTASAGERDCFFSNSVSGYNIIDDHHIRVSAGASRSYILETNWNARDLDWTQAIALRSSTGSICTGNGLGVEVIGGEPQRTYPITSITREPEAAPQGS